MDWQPIETAPKDDETWVLAFNGDEYAVCIWTGEYWSDNEYMMRPQPTHWMPLPEPPKPAQNSTG
jgi:hypothetical protein